MARKTYFGTLSCVISLWSGKCRRAESTNRRGKGATFWGGSDVLIAQFVCLCEGGDNVLDRGTNYGRERFQHTLCMVVTK